MVNNNKPHFTIKNKFQKRTELYSDILTPSILSDVCKRVTGLSDYTYTLIDEVNVGRLATLEYNGSKVYISFSETGQIGGRNSSFQSVASAVVRYYQEKSTNKRMCFYFLPSSGNIETSYFTFIYRLMLTAGIEFLNPEKLQSPIFPFITIEDVISARNSNKSRNKGNYSTYLTKSSNHKTQIYGKTYGANKKETTLLCIALSRITPMQIDLYEICEQNLTELPKPDLHIIQMLGKVNVIPTDLRMEQKEFEKNDSLRSPRFIYNLLEKLGPKKCAFCECEIPEIIEGAHIWPVADIKREPDLNLKSRIDCATDGNNGMWLCENHHTLFDEDLLMIDARGLLGCKSNLEKGMMQYITNTTPITQLSNSLFTSQFASYLRKRISRPESIANFKSLNPKIPVKAKTN